MNPANRKPEPRFQDLRFRASHAKALNTRLNGVCSAQRRDAISAVGYFALAGGTIPFPFLSPLRTSKLFFQKDNRRQGARSKAEAADINAMLMFEEKSA